MNIQKSKIKEKLIARKQELEQSLSRFIEARSAVESEAVQDPLDQAIKSSLEDLNITLEEHTRDEYERIEDALKMIDAGTYGTCIDCKQQISEKRLELYPNATRCVLCQEKKEMER